MRLPFYILVLLCILSCNQQPKLEYTFSNKEQVIACNNANNTLLNEMLYSFEEDIMNHNPAESKTINTAYAQYIFKGMTGTSPYDKIINTHSLAVRDQLLAEGILITDGLKSNLNYEHPAVQCILNGIEDQGIKQTLNALIQTNSMNPALFNSRLRNFGRQADKNRYQAAYIALDSYYQNLVGLTLEEQTTNE